MSNPQQPWGSGNPGNPQGGWPQQSPQQGYPAQQAGYPQQGYGAPPQAAGWQQPGAPQGGGFPAPGAGGGYEFDAYQNEVIGSAATWTMVLGIINLLQSVGQLVGQNRNGIASAVYIATGVFLIVASTAFRKVVDTQGNDIFHLTTALKTFSNVLLLRIISLIVMMIAVVLMLFAALAIGAATALR